jgi:hypothetical protein
VFPVSLSEVRLRRMAPLVMPLPEGISQKSGNESRGGRFAYHL